MSYKVYGTAAAGTPKIVRGVPVPATITINGNGGVEFTTSHESSIEAGTALWQAWPKGTIASGTASDVLFGPINGLRFTAATGNLIYEIMSVPDRSR